MRDSFKAVVNARRNDEISVEGRFAGVETGPEWNNFWERDTILAHNAVKMIGNAVEGFTKNCLGRMRASMTMITMMIMIAV